MTDADDINMPRTGDDPVDEKADRKAKRMEDARRRAAESRLARKRSLPADVDTVCATLVLCMLDMRTLPPSMRQARASVIADVVRQTHRTLKAMGHPDVHQSVVAVVEATAERLRTERWHHPLSHGAISRHPVDTYVTPSARDACTTDRIAEPTDVTARVRTARADCTGPWLTNMSAHHPRAHPCRRSFDMPTITPLADEADIDGAPDVIASDAEISTAEIWREQDTDEIAAECRAEDLVNGIDDVCDEDDEPSPDARLEEDDDESWMH